MLLAILPPEVGGLESAPRIARFRKDHLSISSCCYHNTTSVITTLRPQLQQTFSSKVKCKISYLATQTSLMPTFIIRLILPICYLHCVMLGTRVTFILFLKLLLVNSLLIFLILLFYISPHTVISYSTTR
jgi:hypothetical protein